MILDLYGGSDLLVTWDAPKPQDPLPCRQDSYPRGEPKPRPRPEDFPQLDIVPSTPTPSTPSPRRRP